MMKRHGTYAQQLLYVRTHPVVVLFDLFTGCTAATILEIGTDTANRRTRTKDGLK